MNAKKKKSGPVEVIESKGVKIPIYNSPTPSGKPGFLLSYYVEGKRVQERAGTLDDARQQARAKIKELTTGTAHVGTLTPRQTAIVTDAVGIAQGIGVSLTDAMRQYAEAFKILAGKGTIVDAARLFVEHHEQTTIPAISFKAVVGKFLERNEVLGYSVEYKNDCRKHLTILSKALGTAMIGNIRQSDITSALQTATGKSSARRYNNLRGTVNAMFTFAQREGFLPRDKKHEAALVEARNDRSSGVIEIYTPAQLETILKHIAPEQVPWVVLSGLAGLRTSEVHRLTWEMLRFDAKVIILEKSFTKTKRRRVIPMCDALIAWLKPHIGQGRLYDCSLVNFEYRMRTAWAQIVGKDGKLLVPKKKNGLRHSYGSYRFAILQDENKVSAEMGNSPSELREHYAEIALPGDAKKWFAILPEKKRPARKGTAELAKVA